MRAKSGGIINKVSGLESSCSEEGEAGQNWLATHEQNQRSTCMYMKVNLPRVNSIIFIKELPFMTFIKIPSFNSAATP